MIKGFGHFLMRGNVVDLAVAVVIGGAFGAIVTAFVKDLLTPLVAALFGKPDFAALAFTINGSRFAIGDFTNAEAAARAGLRGAGSNGAGQRPGRRRHCRGRWGSCPGERRRRPYADRFGAGAAR